MSWLNLTFGKIYFIARSLQLQWEIFNQYQTQQAIALNGKITREKVLIDRPRCERLHILMTVDGA